MSNNHCLVCKVQIPDNKHYCGKLYCVNVEDEPEDECKYHCPECGDEISITRQLCGKWYCYKAT